MMRKTMTWSESSLDEFGKEIIKGNLRDSPVIMELDDFKSFYSKFVSLTNRKIPDVTCINLGDQVQLIFPAYSRQEIVIRENKRKLFSLDDFSFLSIKNWLGPKKRAKKFVEFLWDELVSNKGKIIVVFLVTFIAFIFIGNDDSNFDLINSILVQASTVFFSIYLIFTVSQSERLSSDRKLFEKGILFNYYNDDRNVTLFAIITIGFAILNTLIVHFPPIQKTLDTPLSIAYGRWIISFTTAFVSSMLFHTFFIVADYYLERTRDIAEREHIGDIFHEEYCKHHPDQCQ